MIWPVFLYWGIRYIRGLGDCDFFWWPAWIGCKATIENDQPCECWNLDHIYWPIMRWTWWQQHVFVADTTSLVEKRSIAVDVRIPVPFYGLGTTIYFNPRTLSGRYMWSQCAECATCKERFRSSLESFDTDLDLTGLKGFVHGWNYLNLWHFFAGKVVFSTISHFRVPFGYEGFDPPFE